ncbi:biopolymer transporter ExbD [Pectobacterium cacticida]|uniref:biopolymer transporter ExbD n=1 Tax=Pectobacterium cacticida TaxID=69221 RepID=UPI002FF3A8DB
MAFTPQSSDDDLNALSDINVTPFIDVMLVLLIIFMVTAPLATSNIDIDLPSTTKAPQPDNQQPLIINLKEGGDLFIKDRAITRNEFTREINQASNNNTGTRIFIRADKNVNYQALISLMDLLRDNGYLKVSLIGMDAGGHTKETGK